ncbi:MAG TPA: M48 family metalloprotease [Polyangiaceae bacterium]
MARCLALTELATFSRSGRRALVVISFAVASLACKREPSGPASQPQAPGAYYPGQQQPYPTTAPGQPAPGAAPGQPVPGPAPAHPAPAPIPIPTTATNPATDPIQRLDLGFLRAEAQSILNELVAALPPLQLGRVQGIPLVVDSTVGEVNAFATCSGRRSAMAITDGLLEIQAELARARAHDELAQTRKVDEYIRLVAQRQRPKQPIVHPAAGFYDPRVDADPRKLARQREVLDEQIAFVLGHELAHHYLGHLPCTASGVLGAAEIGNVLSSAIPAFNQPNELAADTFGLNDLLTAGARRSGYKFTEGGALLTMQFFSGMDQFSPVDLFDFERSHPPPAIRTPVIQQTAAAWRGTGGRGLPYPLF